MTHIGGLLLDEHVLLIIREQLQRLAPHVAVFAIGDGIAPAKGTSDPDILVWIEKPLSARYEQSLHDAAAPTSASRSG